MCFIGGEYVTGKLPATVITVMMLFFYNCCYHYIIISTKSVAALKSPNHNAPKRVSSGNIFYRFCSLFENYSCDV